MVVSKYVVNHGSESFYAWLLDASKELDMAALWPR